MLSVLLPTVSTIKQKIKIVIKIRWAEHVTRMGETRDVYRLLVRKTEGKRPLGRHKRRWEDNIKKNLQEWDGKAWIGLIWLRFGTVAGSCNCGNKCFAFIKCGEILD